MIGVDDKLDPYTMSSKTLKPLRELVKAEFISDGNVFDWRSLSINHISDKLQKQCPKNYFSLNKVILEYNKDYRGLEKKNEAWMKEKIKSVIGGINPCREELKRYYVNFSHEIIGPLHRAYNLDNPGSVYNKDEFRYLDVHFVNYLQETPVVRGSRFSGLRSMLVNYKDWQDICVTGEGGVKRKGFIIFSSEIV